PDDHARRLMGTGPIVVIPRRLTINQLHQRGVDTADTVVVEPVVAAVHPPTAHGVQALDVLAGAEGAVGGEGGVGIEGVDGARARRLARRGAAIHHADLGAPQVAVTDDHRAVVQREDQVVGVGDLDRVLVRVHVAGELDIVGAAAVAVLPRGGGGWRRGVL